MTVIIKTWQIICIIFIILRNVSIWFNLSFWAPLTLLIPYVKHLLSIIRILVFITCYSLKLKFSSSSGIRFIRNITKSIQHSHTVSLFDHMKTNANCLKQKNLRVVISLIISCFSWVLTLRRGNILYSGAQLTQQCTQKLKSIQTAHVLEWFWCASEVQPLPRCC